MRTITYLIACAAGCLVIACATTHAPHDPCPAQVHRTDPPDYVRTGPARLSTTAAKTTKASRTRVKKNGTATNSAPQADHGARIVVAAADRWTCPVE